MNKRTRIQEGGVIEPQESQNPERRETGGLAMSETTTATQRLYRIDKFKVPAEAQCEFLDRVHMTHAILRTLPGFIEDHILEQTSGPGVFNVVTLAIWANAASVEHAKTVVAAKQRGAGFDPKELLSRLHIEADLATYAEIRT